MFLKRLRFRILAVLIGLGIIVAPCALCFWIFWWPDIHTQASLRTYPNLRRVGDDYQYFGADTGLMILHYWTADSIEEVRSYYESFAYPFVLDPWRGGLITVFSIDGVELIYMSVEGKKSPLDFPTNKSCHYRQPYKCVNVNLRDLNIMIGKLPNFKPGLPWLGVHSLSPATTLPQGTLVTYSYYIDDF